jgi:hypothetical protein
MCIFREKCIGSNCSNFAFIPLDDLAFFNRGLELTGKSIRVETVMGTCTKQKGNCKTVIKFGDRCLSPKDKSEQAIPLHLLIIDIFFYFSPKAGTIPPNAQGCQKAAYPYW